MGKHMHEGYMTERKDRYSYWVFFIGQNLIYWMVTNYLMMFYTDYLIIPPYIITILMFVSKVWDAINDPLFGIVVDKAHLKKGKFIPWIRIGTSLLPLITICLFIIPQDCPTGTKVTLAFLSYLIWDLLYTVSDVPIYALSTVMTASIEERSGIISIARFFASAGGVIISLVVAPLVEDAGFALPALLVGAAGYLTMLPICKFAKERVAPQKDKSQEAVSFRALWNYIIHNKYLLIVFVGICVFSIFSINLNLYVAKYCLGSLDYVTITTLVTIVPGTIVFFVVPIMLKHIDKIKLYIIAMLGNALLGVIAYFVGYSNIVMYMIIAALRAFAGSIPSLLMFTFAPDCVEYGQYKTGARNEGICFSLQTFTSKFTSAIATALSGVVLTIMCYDATLEAQPAEIIDGFWNYSIWVPIVGALISLPIFLKYKLKDKDVQIMADCNTGKITKQEAEKLLSQKF